MFYQPFTWCTEKGRQAPGRHAVGNVHRRGTGGAVQPFALTPNGTPDHTPPCSLPAASLCCVAAASTAVLLLLTAARPHPLYCATAVASSASPLPRHRCAPLLPQVSHSGCGWVHGVAWAPGDLALLYTSHDSVLSSVRGPQVRESRPARGASRMAKQTRTCIRKT